MDVSILNDENVELTRIAELMTPEEFLLIEKWRISAAVPVGDCLVVFDMWHDDYNKLYYTEAYNELDQKTYLNVIDMKNIETDFDSVETQYPDYDGYQYSCYQDIEDRIKKSGLAIGCGTGIYASKAGKAEFYVE